MQNVGTQERMDLYFGTTLIGEIHNLAANTLTSIDLNVPDDFDISENMGGFYLKASDRTISPSGTGDAPRFLLIADGRWQWPGEGVNISTVYPSFKDWVSNPNTQWYTVKDTEIDDKSTADTDINNNDDPEIEDGAINSEGGDGPYKASLSFADKVLNTSYVNWYWARPDDWVAPIDNPNDEDHHYYIDSHGGTTMYDGHDYHILFTSYDTPRMLDAFYLNEGTYDLPNEVTNIHINWEEKKANELPLGTYEGKKFSVHIWNSRQVGTTYYYGYMPDLNEFSSYLASKMTISKDGDDYVITITNLTLKGGPQDEDGHSVDDKFYTNLSFTYKGPLPKLPEKYWDVIGY